MSLADVYFMDGGQPNPAISDMCLFLVLASFQTNTAVTFSDQFILHSAHINIMQ